MGFYLPPRVMQRNSGIGGVYRLLILRKSYSSSDRTELGVWWRDVLPPRTRTGLSMRSRLQPSSHDPWGTPSPRWALYVTQRALGLTISGPSLFWWGQKLPSMEEEKRRQRKDKFIESLWSDVEQLKLKNTKP